MKIKIFPIFICIIFISIFFIFYKGLQNSNIYVPNTNIKKDIPNFNAKVFNSNEKINSSNIFKNDKFYLMNIWASWCVPCRDEHPFLINLSNERNIEIIGLNYKDDVEKAKFFLKKYDSPYKFIFSDIDGTIAINWGAYGVPETYLIYNKKIIKKIVGPLNEVSLIEIKNLIQ
jgi:cytochrome c biogenesis protein CcmG/thiol:disulfide interchange protein DsbE|tara:strand:- start:867 stop:1385 length:519 start_codon:yes stop_codon:yes gene_type:complete